jgi:predicted deacylase
VQPPQRHASRTQTVGRTRINLLEDEEFQMNSISHQLRLKIVPHKDTYFNSKIVLVNLEEVLNKMGIKVRSVETREKGRGTPMAIRATIENPRFIALEFQSAIKLEVHKDTYFDHKVILGGLENALEAEGIHIVNCETRQAGQDTPIAIRAALVIKSSS